LTGGSRCQFNLAADAEIDSGDTNFRRRLNSAALCGTLRR
jgi:hypothetical protein